MAQPQIKVDAGALPFIANLIGSAINGDPMGPQPPLQAAENSPDPSPDASAAAPPPPVDPGPTKLDLLKTLVGGKQPAPMAPPVIPQAPPDLAHELLPATPQLLDQGTPQGSQTPGNDIAAPSTISGMVNAPLPAGIVAPPAGEGQVHATFAEAHPKLNSFLHNLVTFAQNAGPGIGSQTFGQGFETATQQPFIRAQQKQNIQKGAAELAQTQAKTAEIKSHAEDIPVTITGPDGLPKTVYLPKDKVANSLVSGQGKKDVASQADATKRLLGLRKQGMTLDENGQPQPIPYEQLSTGEQAHIDLQKAQTDANAARAEMDKAKGDPNSPAYQLALGKLKATQQNASIALGRLGLSRDTFNANYFGVGPGGQALPGAPLDDSGNPVGIKTAGITKPTNATRSKAEQGGVIIQQGNDLINQIRAHPDIYGAVAGRWSALQAGHIGDASPEVRDAYTSLKSFASLQPALHGSRGIGMQKEFEDAVGGMGNNPEGLVGSINSLMRTASTFQKAGTMKTASGTPKPKATAAAASTPAPTTHDFSVSGWQSSHPGQDAAAAKAAAQKQGFNVIP